MPVPTIYGKTYAEAREWLAKGRSGWDRPIANNTRIEWDAESATVCVRLHATVVVRLFLNGMIELQTGGWFTMTTSDRINCALDREHMRIYRTGVEAEWGIVTGYHGEMGSPWWCGDEHAYRVDFFNGIRFDRRGRCVNGPQPFVLRARRARLLAKSRRAQAERRQLVRRLMLAATTKTLTLDSADAVHLITALAKNYERPLDLLNWDVAGARLLPVTDRRKVLIRNAVRTYVTQPIGHH